METLGPRIGVGRTAEVYALGPDRVAKLMVPSFSPDYEAEIHGLVADAGAPAPAIHGTIEHDGRMGIVFERVDGEEMTDRIVGAPFRSRPLADRMAAVHVAIHATSSDDLPDVKERLALNIDHANDALDYSTRETAKQRLRALEDGDRVLHGDLHPGNILMAADRDVAIDWTNAVRGPIEPDIVRTLWMLSMTAVPPEHRRFGIRFVVDRFRHRYLASYEQATGLDRARLAPWRLPVLAARLAEGIEHEEADLVAAVRALARS